MYSRLIILSLLILLSLNAYCQITITDKGYTVTRDFLEFTAARFDSLKTYKEAHRQCTEVLDYSLVIIQNQDTLAAMNAKKILSLEGEIETQSEIIESYKRSEIISEGIKKQLKAEIRKRKTWQVISLGLGLVGIGSTAYFLLR